MNWIEIKPEIRISEDVEEYLELQFLEYSRIDRFPIYRIIDSNVLHNHFLMEIIIYYMNI